MSVYLDKRRFGKANYDYWFDDVANPMTKQECIEWIDALRSGEYKQGKGMLFLTVPERSYCCLGVEQKIHPEQCDEVDSETSLLRKALQRRYRLPYLMQHDLMCSNDRGDSFEVISDFIEANILPILKD